ncbi:MAG: sugar ABC transporter permease [Devosia sp.]|uniref:carbohydrate ABC transporter permease n=1 Tax=Devosia sp. TaxID=1871048 RepID=UPI001AC15CD0|nr:sugar ABC transporter permease [Devosia sp.]MBN9316838.1 sugar ABC transporter permease [Devosia sp.]
MNRSIFTNPYVLIAPAFLLAAFIILWPLSQIGEISISNVNRFGQLKGFAGLENFAAVVGDPQFLAAAWRTVIWTLGIVAGTILLSVPVALVLNEDFHGRGIARIIVMLPWAVSLTMTAIVWRWALSGESGMLNSALKGLGLVDQNIQWLAAAGTAFPMQIAIGILVSIPFTTTIFLGGLSSIPDDLYEAARLEGASSWQIFFSITLPLLRPFINIAVVMNTIGVFNSFPIIWVTTQGGPANSTDILVTYLYKLGFSFGKLGEASALSLMMFALLLFFTIIYVRLAMRGERA